MFENFRKFFRIKAPEKGDVPDTRSAISGYNEFFRDFDGQSFMNGLYRVPKQEEIGKWNEIVTEAFPNFQNRINVFGYDWLGRVFSLDFQRIVNGQPQVLLLDPGTGEVLQLPFSFVDFHEKCIPEQSDACLAIDFFKEWVDANPDGLKNSECAGYKVPLFLGGVDDMSNIEKSDMEVYWSICTQLM